MRKNGSSSGGGGVASGVYPSPLFMKYVPCKNFETFADLTLAEGSFIPDNYNDSESQTNIDDTYDDVRDAFPERTGPIADGQSLKYKAANWANYTTSKILTLRPYARYGISVDNFLLPSGGNEEDHQRIFDVSSTKKGMMWISPEDDFFSFHFKIGDTSTGRTVWGAAQKLTGVKQSSSAVGRWDIRRVSDGQMIVMFQDDDNSDRISAVAFDIDGSDLLDTVGAIAEISTDSNQPIITTAFVAPQKVFILWRDSTFSVVLDVNVSTLAITVGANNSVTSGDGASGSKVSAEYLADDKILAIWGDSASTGLLYARVITVSGTTQTNQTVEIHDVGVSNAINRKAMWTVTDEKAYIWTLRSSTTEVTRFDISGNTVSFVKRTAFTSSDVFMGNRFDGTWYQINTDGTITKYDENGNAVEIFIDSDLNFGGSPNNEQGLFNNRDLQNGISIYGRQVVSNQTSIGFTQMSSGLDVDVAINGISVHTNTTTDVFGLTLNVEGALNSKTAEIEITNQSGGDRTFEPVQFITSVT